MDVEVEAYEMGFSAFFRGWPRTANPYIGTQARAEWFRGWDAAKKAGAK